MLDLPTEVVEQILGFVDEAETKRALRLTCSRLCNLVDFEIDEVKTTSAVQSPAHLGVLVNAQWLLTSVDLDISRLDFGAAASALAAADWPYLYELYLLGDYRTNTGTAEMGAAGAAALAAAHWPGLEGLWISDIRLGPAAAAHLAAAHWPDLEMLNLIRTDVGDAGAAALAAAAWPGLEVLCLEGNDLGPAGVASLAAAHRPLLETVCLSLNDIGVLGVEALAAAAWPSLQELDLSMTYLNGACVAKLAGAAFNNLKKLVLSENLLGRAGWRALTQAQGFPSLEELDISACKIAPRHAAAIRALAHARWPRLHTLDLRTLLEKDPDADEEDEFFF